MSATSLGDFATCGQLNCNVINAKNGGGGDKHKISGDLEITGDLKVDGGMEIDNGDWKGLTIKGNPNGAGQPLAGIGLNDLTQTWSITADSQFNTMFIDHTINGSGSGSNVAQFNKTANGFGCSLPANPLVFEGIPTSAAGLPTGAVWSNAGVLNIVQ